MNILETVLAKMSNINKAHIIGKLNAFTRQS